MTETNFSDEPVFTFDEPQVEVKKKRGRPRKVVAEQLEPVEQFMGDEPQFVEHKPLRNHDGLIRSERFDSGPPVLVRIEGKHKVSWKTNYDPRNPNLVSPRLKPSIPVFTKASDFTTRKGDRLGVSRGLAQNRQEMSVPAFGNAQARFGPARKRSSF